MRERGGEWGGGVSGGRGEWEGGEEGVRGAEGEHTLASC